MKSQAHTSQILLGSILIVLLTISCGQKNDADNKETDTLEVPQATLNSFRAKAQKVKNLLIEKKSTVLDSLLNGHGLTASRSLVLYYSSIDCSSCIHTGLDFLSKIERTGDLQTGPILTGVRYVNGPLSQVPGFIHDEKAQIQKEIGYILTPSLIYYDRDRGILDFYLIPTFKDSVGLAKFEQILITSNDKS